MAVIDGLARGVKYFFEVIAYDTNHDESAPCPPVSYTIAIVTWNVTTSVNPNGGGG